MNWNSRRFLPVLSIGLTLVMGILIGSVLSRGVRAAKEGPMAPGATLLPPPSPVELSNSFAKIAETVVPSVVNIRTETTIHVSRRRFRGPDDSPFGDFFDRFFQYGEPGGPPRDIPQQSLGSGIILDKNGYVLTNFHVIMQDGENRPVDRIRVQLHDDPNSKGCEAKIVGTDKWTDLAVIKINAGKALPAAQLGDSDSMRVGDWVLAVGTPFELESTVTAGIVSAKGRDIEGGTEGEFKRFIQTDAAINPGNSGGPLVNLAGQVIGINTAIATNRGSSDGIGFAIPSNTARKVYNAIITSGTVPRGAIGIRFIGQQNPALLRSFGADHGVVVDLVEHGGPAEAAGLKMGDVITAVDGKPIHNGDELVAMVSDSEIGRKLRVDYLRDGAVHHTEVVVGDRNKIVSSARSPQDNEGGGESAEAGGNGVLGLSVRNLTREQASDLANELQLHEGQGVLVMDVQPNSFSFDLGLQRGDVILSINHQTVSSVDDFNRLQSKLKSGNDVLFLVARRMQGAFTTLFLADRLP